MTSAHAKRPREMPIYIVVCAALLIVGFVVGVSNPTGLESSLMPVVRRLMASIQPIRNEQWPHMFFHLFLHNAASATELVIFGLAFGLFSIYMMWVNGLLAGFVVGLIAVRHVAVWKLVVFGLMPHGIFELSAIVWAAGLGLQNGFAVIRVIRLAFRPSQQTVDAARGHVPFREAHPLRFSLYRTARSLPIIWGMLVIAALIEAAVTPHILAWAVPGLHQLAVSAA